MTEKKLQGIAESFQTYLAEHGKHLNTIRSYGNDLRQFFTWCRSTFGSELDLSMLTRSDVQDFRAFLLTRNASPASVNRKVTALRQFFEFCRNRDFISSNPASNIGGVTADPKPPTVLLRKDALLLVRTAERQAGSLDASIILLLLHAGLRSSELCALTVGNVHLTPREGRLFIKGQRGKTTRFVFLSMRAQNSLRQYMRQRGISVLAKRLRNEALFLTHDGSPLTQQAVDQIVKRVGRLVGMAEITPSMLRNTYAANQLQSGASPEAVALTMGVASLKSIQRLKEHLDDDTDVE
ncbi:MAG: tyrosine-type recombinase/integrase [Bacteroidia bacterium]|nr:tyrosine-type recombinase/integrase [Bacteroidia bacterium]